MTDENAIETEEYETEEVFEEIVEKAETAEETARAVWEELAAKAETEAPKEGEAPPVEEKPNEISEAARKLAQAKRGKKRQTFVPADSVPAQAAEAPAAEAPVEKYEPPAAWTAADKEQFYKLDPLSQKNSLTWFKNAQAHSTRLWQEMNAEKTRAKEIAEVADEYIPKMKIPPGMTKGQVVKQLFEYQRKINEDDVGAIVEMIQHRKLTLQDLQARMQGQTQAPARQAAQVPQNSVLTPEEVDRRVKARLEEHFQTQAADSATEDVRKVQREMQDGKFVYPELHDAAYIQRIQPLISYFRGNNPGIGWGEVYKLAVQHDRQARGVAPATPSPTSSRLTPETIQSVKQASSSLRSRGGNGAIPRMSEPKPNETARESAEAAYYEIFGNKQH